MIVNEERYLANWGCVCNRGEVGKKATIYGHQWTKNGNVNRLEDVRKLRNEELKVNIILIALKKKFFDHVTAVTVKNKELRFPEVLERRFGNEHVTQPLERDLIIPLLFFETQKVPIFKKFDTIKEPLLLT